MAKVPEKYSERYGKADTGRLPPGVANPVDQHVGSRLRQRRTLLGLSQEKLGEAVGLTFQQIQKYEKGANRVGASRLFQFSEVLDVDISYFFEEMPAEIRTRRGAYNTGLKDQEQESLQPNPMARRETLELVRYYYRNTDPSKFASTISYLVDGTLAIRTLNRALDWHLPDDEANTVAGLVIHEAKVIPEVGEGYDLHGFRFEIVGKEGNRLTRLRVRPLLTDAPPSD